MLSKNMRCELCCFAATCFALCAFMLTIVALEHSLDGATSQVRLLTKQPRTSARLISTSVLFYFSISGAGSSLPPDFDRRTSTATLFDLRAVDVGDEAVVFGDDARGVECFNSVAARCSLLGLLSPILASRYGGLLNPSPVARHEGPACESTKPASVMPLCDAGPRKTASFVATTYSGDAYDWFD